MKIAFVSVLLVALGAAGSAQAAVSVLGSGKAHVCYTHAEYNIDPKSGIEVCDDALKSDILSRKDRSATLINRAILKSRTNDMNGAMDDYGQAIDLGGNPGEAYLNRAATLIAMKRYADAFKDADQAIQLNAPRIEVAYYNRGLANECLGNLRAAYDDYQKALSLEPRFTAAADQLARFHLVRSDT